MNYMGEQVSKGHICVELHCRCSKLRNERGTKGAVQFRPWRDSAKHKYLGQTDDLFCYMVESPKKCVSKGCS